MVQPKVNPLTGFIIPLSASPVVLPAPYNTMTPQYDMELRLAKDNGETISIPMSKTDICDNNGSDILDAVLQLMTACQTEANLISHSETKSANTTVPTTPGAIPPMQNFWCCVCGTYNNGKFCTGCGASKPNLR